jgi:hypothetical protein
MPSITRQPGVKRRILMSTQETAITESLQEIPGARLKSQYTVLQILGIWLAGGAPLWIFGWVIHPTLSQGLPALDKGLLWMELALVGVVWQFVLSMLILSRRREHSDIDHPPPLLAEPSGLTADGPER